MEKYQGKYRIPSNRHQDYNYSSAGDYYVTLCALNRIHYFGEIDNSILKLSEIGQFTIHEWLKTPVLRPNMKIILGEYCLMPNHFHAIITFKEGLSFKSNMIPNKFGSQSNNLASIIRGFKGAITSYAIKHNIEFFWQPRYYDHIIRDEFDYNRIETYIKENIINWDCDDYR